MDAEHLDFPKETFDAVVSHAVINKKMCKAPQTLASIKKVLKREGKIIIKLIYATWGKEFGFKGGYNKKELQEILKKKSYKNVCINIHRQQYKAKNYEQVAWVKDTEAPILSPKKQFEAFFAKDKKKYSFDDSFMIIYAEKKDYTHSQRRINHD